VVHEDGTIVPAGTLCYLDIPASKTFRAFVKPVAVVVKERIDAWLKADQMAHMISVLIDHDVIARHSDEPYTFYDLGDSYCSNPFWSSCPHRMACAGCDFNLPKDSTRAQALESKSSIRRYLEAVPLTPDERAIAEGDLEKLESLIRKLDKAPALDGRTPREINERKRRP